MQIHIMVVSENQEILPLFETLLTEEGYQVTGQTFTGHTLADVKRVEPDLLILDCGMGLEGAGWNLLQQLKMDRATVRIPILICSGAVRQVRPLEGWLGAKGINALLKPFEADDLLAVTRKMAHALAKAPASERAGRG
jgi:DNA-binding response OmpR family regulator